MLEYVRRQLLETVGPSQKERTQMIGVYEGCLAFAGCVGPFAVDWVIEKTSAGVAVLILLGLSVFVLLNTLILPG